MAIRITQQQIRERWDTLPTTLREAITSDESTDIVVAACTAEHLSSDKEHVVARLAGYVLIGFLHAEDLGKEIAEALHIDARIGASIADTLNKKIFAALHAEITQIYAPASNETNSQKKSAPLPLGSIAATIPAPLPTSGRVMPVPRPSGMPPAPTPHTPSITFSPSAKSTTVTPTSKIGASGQQAPMPVMLHQEVAPETNKATANFHFDTSPVKFAGTQQIPPPPKAAHVEIGGAAKTHPEISRVETGTARSVNYGAPQPVVNMQFGQAALSAMQHAETPTSQKKELVPPPPPPRPITVAAPTITQAPPASQTVVMPTVHTVERTIEKNYTEIPKTVVIDSNKPAPWKRPEEYAPGKAGVKDQAEITTASPTTPSALHTPAAQPQVRVEMKQVAPPSKEPQRSEPQMTPQKTTAQTPIPTLHPEIKQTEAGMPQKQWSQSAPQTSMQEVKKSTDTLDLSSLQKIAPQPTPAPAPHESSQNQASVNIPAGAPIVINATVAAIQNEGGKTSSSSGTPKTGSDGLTKPRMPRIPATQYPTQEIETPRKNLYPTNAAPPPAYTPKEQITLPSRPSETIQRTDFNQKTIDLSSFQKVRGGSDASPRQNSGEAGPAIDGNTVTLK